MAYLPVNTAEEDLPAALQRLFNLSVLPRLYARGNAKKRPVLLFDIGNGNSLYARYDARAIQCWDPGGSAARIAIFGGLKVLPGASETPITIYVASNHETEKDKNGEPCVTGIVGSIVEGTDGFRFFPTAADRAPSRKAYPDAAACIPKWVRAMVYVRAYDQYELVHAPKLPSPVNRTTT